MNIQDFASKLFGSTRIEESGDLSNRVDSITAAGATASEAGAVGVTLDAEITPSDDSSETDETIIEMPTSPSVDVGDDVIIGLTGEGPLKVPVVLANPGSGDRVASQAQQAIDIAEATGQHFWDADDGAHVTEVTREEWEDSTSPNYHSGPNSLWNSLGMLFRDGLTNLMALISGRTSATITFAGAQSEYNWGQYGMPIGTTGVTSVKADGIEVSSFELEQYGAHLWLNVTAPQATQSIEVTYNHDAAVNFYHNGETTAEIGSIGMSLIKDFDGTEKIGGIDFCNGRTSIIADASGTTTQDSSQGIQISAGDSATMSALINIDSGAGGSVVRIKTNHQDQRYYFPELALIQQGSGNRFYLKTNTVELDYGDINPHGGSTELTMQHVIAMLTTSSANLTRSSAVSSWVGGQVRRSGKVVTVTITGMKLASALASSANSAQLTTLPAGFIPNLTQRVPCAINGWGNFPNVWVAIGTGGGVQMHNGSPTAIPTDREISLNCTYIVT